MSYNGQILLANFIDEISEAANDAERTSDIERAARLREHIRRLQFSVFGMHTADVEISAATPILDDAVREKVTEIWGEFGKHELTHIGGAVLIDFDAHSTIAIRSNGLIMTGAALGDAKALMLAARHAKEHWNGRVTEEGNDIYCMKAAIANELFGVETVGYVMPDRLRPQANVLRREWQSVRDELIASSLQPSAPSGSPKLASHTATPILTPA